MTEQWYYCTNCKRLEAALAECERERERLNHLHNLDHSLADQWHFKYDEAERKLAAARECRQAENSDDRPRGWQDWCITHSQSVWRCLAALTEAGEGRNDADIR